MVGYKNLKNLIVYSLKAYSCNSFMKIQSTFWVSTPTSKPKHQLVGWNLMQFQHSVGHIAPLEL